MVRISRIMIYILFVHSFITNFVKLMWTYPHVNVHYITKCTIKITNISIIESQSNISLIWSEILTYKFIWV